MEDFDGSIGSKEWGEVHADIIARKEAQRVARKAAKMLRK